MESENNENTVTLTIFNWIDVRCHSTPLDPAMLTKYGLLMNKKCQLTKASTRTDLSEPRFVKFDRDFIKFRLAKLISPLLTNATSEQADLVAILLVEVLDELAPQQVNEPVPVLKTNQIHSSSITTAPT